jgi:hypothetical protein
LELERCKKILGHFKEKEKYDWLGLDYTIWLPKVANCHILFISKKWTNA